MPVQGTSRSTSTQSAYPTEQQGASPQGNAGAQSSQRPTNPQLSGLTRPPHSVGQVQDTAKTFFAATTGTSPKVVAGSESAEMQALRKQPATAENMEKLAALEHGYANGPGPATTPDTIAAKAGSLRVGAAHFAASTAALGAGGLRGADAAGYLAEHVEHVTTNF
ncbi:hypothetical protein C5O80_23775 [Burkholderia sp. SRS-46]|nr:hypothetical protein C5O80_23775 [Burkholderia sp. SRS-46]